MRLKTEEYKCLEIFLKSSRNANGFLQIRKTGTEEYQKYNGGQYQFILFRIPLDADSEYDLEFTDCQCSIAYLSECDEILNKGVRFLEIEDGECIPTRNLAEWYDQNNREQYHFNAYKNWINDPNGLCWYQGYYHMYYQANPHEQEWGHMYWGHAVSKDCIHWVHLPYVLVPQDEILLAPDKKGGAFSGSAVALEDKIVFYLTRHFGPPEDTEEDTVQYQTMVTSKDGIHFGEEKVIIEKPDSGFSYNFRDPKVSRINGNWHMVIGTKVNKIPAIVQYTSSDMENWDYQGIFLEENTKGVYTLECPDFFQLNDKYIAVASWMVYADEHRRFQPTYYYIGDYNGKEFVEESKGLYDFVGNYYAVQSFEHENRRIAIGWVSDFYHEHIEEKNTSYGSMALPRELTVKNGKLYKKPIREVYSLISDCMCKVKGQNLSLKNLNENCYYTKITFSEETDFHILLGKTENSSITFIRNGKEMELKTEGVASHYVKFDTQIEKLKTVEIFADRRLIEVYLNDGEEAGTKLFYHDNRDGVFQAKFADENSVEQIEIYKMKSIWGEEKR